MEKNILHPQTFYQAVEQTADAIFITQTDGKIIYVNPAFEQITGFSKTEALGKNPSIVKSGLQSKQHYQKLWKTILSGKVFRAIVVNKRKDGTLFYADHTITPIKNSSGKIIHFVGIWKDVTSKVQFEKQKDEFIATASHELKNPLSVIKALSQLLTRRFQKEKDSKLTQISGQINAQVDRMTKLIQELFDISRIESNKLILKVERFELSKIVKQTFDEFVQTDPKHKYIYNAKITKSVLGDKDRIKQVLINLLANARKYSREGSKIILKVQVDKKKLVVSIQDFGKGIPKKDQSKIFEKFYSGYDRQGEANSGLGLGLFISSEIIKKHGGQIWVQSQLKKGATFFFSLPIS